MRSYRRALALLAGPLLCGLVLLLPTPEALGAAGQASLSVLALCVVWWLLTPVDLPVTSLVGLGLLPMVGALPVKDTMALFGNQAVFFVIGVFLVASVMMQTGLSTRLALWMLRRFARTEDTLCRVVLLLSWSLCAVVVSHAVAALMLPIVLGMIRALDLSTTSRTARRLLLSMAWGTVCGSNLTLLSSARASLALEFYNGFRSQSALSLSPIGFGTYSLAAAPVSLAAVLLAGVLLRLLFPPEGRDLQPVQARLAEQAQELGPMSSREVLTALVVAGMIVAMVVGGPETMSAMALLFSGALFALRVLSWEDAVRYVNWGVVLLYGGAIAVGGALDKTGATTWLVGVVLPDSGLGPGLTFAAVALMASLFTEMVSNSAVMAVLLPVALPLSEKVGLHPQAVAMLAPICAGFAYILPTSTPAMAMVFGTGYLRIRDTLPGMLITLASLAAFFALVAFVWPLLGLPVLQ